MGDFGKAYSHMDLLRYDRRIMRDVLLVRQNELKGMRAGRKRYLFLCLSRAEMKVIGIIRNRLVENRSFGIDDKMMMSRVRLHHPGWRHSHIGEAKANGRVWVDEVPVVGIDEVDFRIRRRRAPARFRDRLAGDANGALFDVNPHNIRHHRRIVGHMLMIGEEELQRMLAGRQREFHRCLPTAKMQMIGIARDLMIERGKGRVDEQMMVAAIRCCGSRGSQNPSLKSRT